MPVQGTPLENNGILSSADLIKTAALFRIINPEAVIRFAGGRTLFDTPAQVDSLKYGFDGIMVGNYLTRKGREIESDIANLTKNGFSIVAYSVQ